jgi:hypothetical protein
LWEGFLRGPLEIFGEMELLRLLDQFFDRAICYTAEGYEAAKLAAMSPHRPAARRSAPAASSS